MLVINERVIKSLKNDDEEYSVNIISKTGNSLIEYDPLKNETMISGCDGSFCILTPGMSIEFMNRLVFGTIFYYDDYTVCHDLLYDPKINRNIIFDDEGFGIVRCNYEYYKEKLIREMDLGENTDDCYFHCDKNMFSFSEDMKHVSYVYNNTIYIARTLSPFYIMNIGPRYESVNNISMTGMTVVVSNDTYIHVYNEIGVQ